MVLTPPLPIGASGTGLLLAVVLGGDGMLKLVVGPGAGGGGGLGDAAALDDDPDPDPDPQAPKPGSHPAPQWFSVLPHQPCAEQQSPNLDPLQVIPLPQVPSVLTPRPPGNVASGLLPPGFGSASRQYWEPTVSFEQLLTLGLLCRKAVTLMPASSASFAQVSPFCAMTVRLHTADAMSRRHSKKARMPTAGNDDGGRIVVGSFQENHEPNRSPACIGYNNESGRAMLFRQGGFSSGAIAPTLPY